MPRYLRPLSCLLVMAISAPAFAQDDYQTPDYIREPASLPSDMSGTAARTLTLTDAIELAVANNLSVVLNRHQLSAQEHNVDAARGGYEPEVSASYSHSDTISPPSTAQEGAADEFLSYVNDGWNLGVSQRLRTGTVLSVDLTNSRSSSALGTAVSPLVYRSGLGVSITQPLLRGFSLDSKISAQEILRAELSSQRVREEMRVTIAATVKTTEDAYWDMVQSLKSYHVQLASLELAREQVRLTERQIAAGVLAPVDLINAESTLAQRELTMVQSRAAIDSAADRLRRVLNLPDDAWTTPLLPAEAPTYAPSTLSLDEAITTALRGRPEVSQRKVDLERADFDLRIAKNDRLPKLDVSLSYGLVGQEERYPTALDGMFSFDARAWTAYLNFTWTPLNRAAKASFEALRSGQTSARIQLEREELNIRVEVREAVRAIDTAARQVRAAAKFRNLAERNLDAEQRKFLNGTSSNFFVAQRQDELARSQLSELSAVIQHQKAIANLRLVTGTILEDRNIRLEVAGKRGK